MSRRSRSHITSCLFPEKGTKPERSGRLALFVLLSGSLLFGSGARAESRTWTDAASGKTLEGELQTKSEDGAEIKLKLSAGGRVVTLKAERLSKADQDYIKTWKAAPRGLVIGRVSALSQAQGGKGRVLEDLGSVLSKYGEPKNDLSPHPEVLIYQGPPLSPEVGAVCRIHYLMPRAEAVALLLKQPGIASKKPAVAPGFPPGMEIYTYDIRFLIYNRLYLMVDLADQVISMELKSENTYAEPDPTAGWVRVTPSCATFDYMNTETRGRGLSIVTDVLDQRKEGGFIVVNMAVAPIKETTTWYVPRPLIALMLHNLNE